MRLLRDIIIKGIMLSIIYMKIQFNTYAFRGIIERLKINSKKENMLTAFFNRQKIYNKIFVYFPAVS